MKGFLNQKDNFLSQEIVVVKDNLDTTIDSKIDELNDRVNNDIMFKAKIDNDSSNAEYFENEHVTAQQTDDTINETVRSEASQIDQLGNTSDSDNKNRQLNSMDYSAGDLSET